MTQVPADCEPLKAEEASFRPFSEGLLSTYCVLGPEDSVGSTTDTLCPGAHTEGRQTINIKK